MSETPHPSQSTDESVGGPPTQAAPDATTPEPGSTQPPSPAAGGQAPTPPAGGEPSARSGAGGRRVTRRTVDRSEVTEHTVETITEDIPLEFYAGPSSDHPSPVG